jgi:uracil-DNA glycosylase
VRLTLTLGHLAHDRWLRAAGWWDRLAPSERPRFAHGAEHVLPDGRWLMCAYHPSRQNTNTGRLTQAMWLATFRRARELLDGRAAFKGARREPAAAR